MERQSPAFGAGSLGCHPGLLLGEVLTSSVSNQTCADPSAHTQGPSRSSTLCFSHGCCLVAQLCPTLCDPMNCSPPGSAVHGDPPGENTGVGYHPLFQGIFPTQGSHSGLPHCRRILYRLSHQGSPTLPTVWTKCRTN